VGRSIPGRTALKMIYFSQLQTFIALHKMVDCSMQCRCQAKFLTCEIFDFIPCMHAQSYILHTKYADKTDY